jgi:glutaminyl-peptide cyclotransferase
MYSDYLRRQRWWILLAVIAIFLGGCGDQTDSDSPTTPESDISTMVSTPDAQATPEVIPGETAITEPSATPTPAATPTPSPTPEPERETRLYSYRIINRYPHDPGAFTQGLVYHDGYLYESTGLYGRSTVRRVELETGAVVQIHRLGDGLFGEGLAIMGDEMFQLTWQREVGFVYDRESFELVRQFNYEAEGWGLATDGERLIMSDGSHYLYIRDPESFEELERIPVHDERGPVELLNELEWIDGRIWANVWRRDYIVIIDLETGWVEGRIDFTGLLQDDDRGDRRVDVLNGIAYDPDGGRIFVTGKLWPALYEVEIVPID